MYLQKLLIHTQNSKLPSHITRTYLNGNKNRVKEQEIPHRKKFNYPKNHAVRVYIYNIHIELTPIS